MFIDKTSLHLCMATKRAKNMYIIFGIKPGKELTSSACHQLGFPFILLQFIYFRVVLFYTFVFLLGVARD